MTPAKVFEEVFRLNSYKLSFNHLFDMVIIYSICWNSIEEWHFLVLFSYLKVYRNKLIFAMTLSLKTLVNSKIYIVYHALKLEIWVYFFGNVETKISLWTEKHLLKEFFWKRICLLETFIKGWCWYTKLKNRIHVLYFENDKKFWVSLSALIFSTFLKISQRKLL